MSDPKNNAPALPASTVLLVRDRPKGMEVFMVKRHSAMQFMGGALVFPGGKVDTADNFEDVPVRGGPFDDLGFRVAAIREAFEESAILLARRPGEEEFIDGAYHAQLCETYRGPLHKGELNMGDVARREGIELATDVLVPFAHWITPENNPKRFDTMFYVARAPDDHDADHDGAESVDSVWIRPDVALQDELNKKREIVFPTRLNLAKLDKQKTVDEALAAAAATPIVTVLPVVDPPHIRIPPEAGYDISEELLSRAFHKV